MSRRRITLEGFVKTYFPEIYMRLSGAISEITGIVTPPDAETVTQAGKELGKLIRELFADCTRLELTVSLEAVKDIIQLFETKTGTSTNADWIFAVKHMESTIRQEMRSKVVLLLEPSKVSLAFEPNQFGEAVSTAFPSAAWDVEEAARCLAFDRWTGAVFHLSRVAELITVAIGRRIGYASPKEGFGEVLTFLDNQLAEARRNHRTANPAIKGDIEFLSHVAAQMHAVNQAWRQRVAHLDRKYTEEEATRIWDATRGLVQHLATKTEPDEGTSV